MTNTNYRELAYDFVNTGGNCMVGLTTVYDLKGKRTLYVCCNEEYLQIATYDFINNEFDDRVLDFDDILECSIATDCFTHDPMPDNSSMLNIPDDYALLLSDGWSRFVLNYCGYFNTTFHLEPTGLPYQLENTIDHLYREDYLRWLSKEGMLVEVNKDGVVIDKEVIAAYVDQNGWSAYQLNEELDRIMALMDDDNTREAAYDLPITITIGDKSFEFYMCAQVYNSLYELARDEFVDCLY